MIKLIKFEILFLIAFLFAGCGVPYVSYDGDKPFTIIEAYKGPNDTKFSYKASNYPYKDNAYTTIDFSSTNNYKVGDKVYLKLE